MTRMVSLAALLIMVVGLAFFMYFSTNMRPDSALKPVSETLVPPNIETWHEFSAPEGQFKVLLPTLPHHAQEAYKEIKTNEMRQYDLYISSKEDGTLYTVYLISFPEDKTISSQEEFLKSFINEMLAVNPKNKIKSMEPTIYQDGKAIDFAVENEDVTIDGKAFMNGKTLYVLSSTTKNDNRNQKEFAFFINSFQLGKKGEVQPFTVPNGKPSSQRNK